MQSHFECLPPCRRFLSFRLRRILYRLLLSADLVEDAFASSFCRRGAGFSRGSVRCSRVPIRVRCLRASELLRLRYVVRFLEFRAGMLIAITCLCLPMLVFLWYVSALACVYYYFFFCSLDWCGVRLFYACARSFLTFVYDCTFSCVYVPLVRDVCCVARLSLLLLILCVREREREEAGVHVCVSCFLLLA